MNLIILLFQRRSREEISRPLSVGFLVSVFLFILMSRFSNFLLETSGKEEKFGHHTILEKEKKQQNKNIINHIWLVEDRRQSTASIIQTKKT